MTVVAAVDCGTNSIRLLVADVAPPTSTGHGSITELAREMRIVRLGQGVDATGRFAPDALARTFAACEEFAEIIAEHQPAAVRFVATSASRDVSNREEFAAGIHARLGVEPEVISGAEEAELSFIGATAGVAAALDTPPPAPYLVVDLGGGSTELVLGTQSVDQAFSMDIGCVRITERHLKTDPPTQAEIDAAIVDIDAALSEAAQYVDLSRARSLIGVAGTITTVTADVLDLPTYDRRAIHGAHLRAADIATSATRLLSETREVRAGLGFMHPGRVDVIGAGALIFSRIVARVCEAAGREAAVREVPGGEVEIRASESDILDGTALKLARASST